MKAISIAVAGVTLVLIAATLVPAAGEYRQYFAAGALLGAVVVLATIVVGWRDRPLAAAIAIEPATQRANAAVQSRSATMSTPLPAPSAQSEVIAFLAALQEKGRLVDFLQEPVSSYSDAQVGAAARVVHQGCKAALDEYLRIVPVRQENEGASITVPAGYAADEYRLVGKISGQAPFAGKLIHRGWKTESVNLPRVLRSSGERLPAIAPAEVELR